MRYIGAGTHLAALTGGQLPSEVQQHHQVVRVNGAELYCRPFYSYFGARLASVVESVDTATLKVAAYGRAGSSPAGGTNQLLPKPSPVETGWDAVPDVEQRSPTGVGVVRVVELMSAASAVGGVSD